jgi:hypothetical protein
LYETREHLLLLSRGYLPQKMNPDTMLTRSALSASRASVRQSLIPFARKDLEEDEKVEILANL